jgi:peptidoglycan biosynthesis protein MviN/MurJ (putative lipid II flippase)
LNILVAWNTRIRAFHPDHLAIVRGMAWVTLFVMLGKLSGAGKEMVLAWRYGVGPEVDGYLFVLNLVTWPLGLWFSVLTVVLVPLAARMRNENPAELPRFRAELLGGAIMLGAVLALVAAVLLPLAIRMQWIYLPPATAAFAGAAVPGLVMLMPLGVLASLFSAWMLAAGLHANTLLEGVPALVIAIAIMAGDGGIAPLVWGTVAGFLFHMSFLAAPLGKRGEINLPRLSLSSPAWQWFRQGFAIMLLGNALMNLIEIIDLMFLVHLGTGAVSTLNYANRVLALILGLGGTAVSRATLPVFSNANFAGGSFHDRERRIHDVSIRWVYIMLGIGVAALLLVWLLAPLGIRMLFQRGAFNVENTAAVASVLRHGALQLPFFFAGLVLVSSLVARGLHRAVAVLAAINLPIKAAANFLLVPHFGINGIALATSVMYAGSFSMLCLYALHVHKRKGEIR